MSYGHVSCHVTLTEQLVDGWVFYFQLVVYLEELSGTLQLDESILEAGIELKDAIQAKCELLVANEVSFLADLFIWVLLFIFYIIHLKNKF